MLTNDWPTLDVLRLRYIARVLEQNGGNKTRAADMLGIDRRTLNRILSRERAKAAQAAKLRALQPAVNMGSAPIPPDSRPAPPVSSVSSVSSASSGPAPRAAVASRG